MTLEKRMAEVTTLKIKQVAALVESGEVTAEEALQEVYLRALQDCKLLYKQCLLEEAKKGWFF